MYEISLVIRDGGNGASVAVGTSSAQSAVFSTTSPAFLRLYSDVNVYVRQGVNPTATTNDDFIPAGNLLRVGPIAPGNRLAFITASGTGVVNICKENE